MEMVKDMTYSQWMSELAKKLQWHPDRIRVTPAMTYAMEVLSL